MQRPQCSEEKFAVEERRQLSFEIGAFNTTVGTSFLHPSKRPDLSFIIRSRGNKAHQTEGMRFKDSPSDWSRSSCHFLRRS
jgi:hypothetical protein